MQYEDVVDLALYHPDHGFYASGGRAGRRGDFLTSPEVGPLFGHVVSRAIDAWWDEQGQPPEFHVVEFGAGPGTLARAILAAEPRSIGALAYTAVEKAVSQRTEHPSGINSVGELTSEFVGAGLTGIVLANELLDNLAFAPIEWSDGQALFAHVEVASDGALREVFLPRTESQASYLIPGRSRIDQRRAAEWVDWIRTEVLAAGQLIVFDYGRAKTEDVEIRSYSQHDKAGDPLEALGTKDITVDVDFEVLQRRVGPAEQVTPQHLWLERHGISQLVDEGRAIWEQGAAVGGLDAIRGLSRVREAEALCDFEGFGAFSVIEWSV